MQHHEFEAPEELRDAIRCFWHYQRDASEEPNFEVQPDGYTEIIFHFGNNLSVVQNDGIKPLPSPFLMGLLNHPLTFQSTENLEIIGVRCYPWTVFDLLGLPAGNDGLRIFDHPITALQLPLSQLINQKDTRGAIDLLCQYFKEAHCQVATDSMLYKAGVAMRNANGNMPVSEVAASAHATVRTLERNFKQSSGYTVKDVSGLIRFEQVRNKLWHEPNSKLSILAHELGYTDQAHLSREFKRYSGTTPAAFAREAKAGKHIGTHNFVAFVQA